MKPGMINDSGKSAKQLAQQIAKQMASEPFEVLKDTQEQISPFPVDRQPIMNNPDQQKQQIEDQTAKSKEIDLRRVKELEAEVLEIQRSDLFKELQKRISEGEEFSLADYGELSMEQKQVLKAQMTAVKAQRAQQQNSGQSIVSKAKPSRRLMGFGQKQKAQEMQTRVEKPVPPSG